MALGAIRPRFRFAVQGTVEDQAARLQSAVERVEDRFVARVLGNHVDITVVRSIRHRWSPCVHLDLRVSEDRADTTEVYGLIGPHPHMWTLYAFVGITILVAAGFGAMLGLSQLFLDQPAWGLWSIPIGLAMFVGLYVVSQVGRRFAAEQTAELMALVRDALGVREMSAECGLT